MDAAIAANAVLGVVTEPNDEWSWRRFVFLAPPGMRRLENCTDSMRAAGPLVCLTIDFSQEKKGSSRPMPEAGIDSVTVPGAWSTDGARRTRKFGRNAVERNFFASPRFFLRGNNGFAVPEIIHGLLGRRASATIGR